MALTRNDRWLITGGGRGAVLVYDRQKDFQLDPDGGAASRISGRDPPDRLAPRRPALRLDRRRRPELSLGPESDPRVAAALAGERCTAGRLRSAGRCRPARSAGFVAARCGDGTVRIFDSTGNGGSASKPRSPGTRRRSRSPRWRPAGAGIRQRPGHHPRTSRTATERGSRPPTRRRESAALLVRRMLAIGHRGGVRLIGRREPVRRRVRA